MGLCGKIKRGLVFVMSAPAGAGKTTLVEMLISQYPLDVERSVSCTTRKPRKHEIDGKDYIFISIKEFKDKIEKNEFLEHARVFSHYYGTLKTTVFEKVARGKHVFLVIDTQGAKILKEQIKACFIFIMPPSLEELEKRLRSRHTETDEKIRERLSWAQAEMQQSEDFDFVIQNDELQRAYESLTNYVKKMEQTHCEYI